ncbi:hypothetical protein PINS_up001305 [Pythium insidiosum]|nr:hypothetical protein PINS_up001305 [Pythium insidiosum]
MAACRKRRSGAVRFLVERNAKLDLIDRSGFSALRWAVTHSDLAIVRLLLKHGVSVTQDGYTANSAMEIALAPASPSRRQLKIVLELQRQLERRQLLQDVIKRKEQAEIKEIERHRQKMRRQRRRQRQLERDQRLQQEQEQREREGDTQHGELVAAVLAMAQSATRSARRSRRRIHPTIDRDKGDDATGAMVDEPKLRPTEAATATATATPPSSASRACPQPESLPRESSLRSLLIAQRDASSSDAPLRWVKVARGAWRERSAVAEHSSATTDAALRTGATSSTHVVPFEIEDAVATERVITQLLTSESQWSAFLHERVMVMPERDQHAPLHVEDLEQ